MNARFTCWLSEDERDALDAMARRERTSVNYLVRTAIRQFLGFEPGRGPQIRVTDVTRNREESAA